MLGQDAIAFHDLFRIGDAAHGKAIDLSQHLALLVKDGDIEGFYLAAVLLAGADVAEETSRKLVVDTHLPIRDGQEEIFSAVVILGEIKRGPGSHIEQRGMLAEGEDIGGEAIFQFNLGQGLAFAHVQAAQRLPARPEIELALLPSAVVGVKDNLPIAATRGNGGAICLTSALRDAPPLATSASKA